MQDYSDGGGQVFESGGYTKDRTYRGPFARAVRASLAGSPGVLPSPEKIEFGIGGDAIFRCLEWLTCILQSLPSRYSITFSIPSPSSCDVVLHPRSFLFALEFNAAHNWALTRLAAGFIFLSYLFCCVVYRLDRPAISF